MFDDEKQLLNSDRAAEKQLQPHHELLGRATRFRRRTVTVLLSLAALVFVFVVPALLPRAHSTSETDDLQSSTDGRIDLTRLFFNALSTDHLRTNLEYYTSGTHAAGANKTQATHTLEYFKKQGIDAEIVEYFPWLNRPL
ncbi:hypothetical protein IWW56_006090, partial [Coemansia sp. RSA 2131]